MHSVLQILATFGQVLQGQLFPALTAELGPLDEPHQKLVRVLAMLQLDAFVPVRRGPGRPPYDRGAIARAFVAKVIFRCPTNRALLDRLRNDAVLRRLCGWERAADIPKEWDLSRAFAAFAEAHFPEQVHAALIARTQRERLIGHISEDATAIEVHEKPKPKPKPETPAPPAARRLHRKAGTPKKPEQMTRLERQCSGKMTLEEMIAELPRDCDVGCKRGTDGRKYHWTGYKLHLAVADGQIPIACLLTSASLHDSQAAVPLAKLTAQRVTNFYDLLDTGYDCEAIRQHSRDLGHVPIIPAQKRGKQEPTPLAPHEAARYRERTAVERVNARLKEEFGAQWVRVRGWAKVMADLMFGVLVLTADQILRLTPST